MATLQHFDTIKLKMASAKTSVMKVIHKFIFESEGDRGNRRRLRDFDGFDYGKEDERYENKIKYVRENLTAGDLVSICNIFELNYEKVDFVPYLFDNLQKGNLLKDRDDEDNDEEDENEIDNNGNASVGNAVNRERNAISGPNNKEQNVLEDDAQSNFDYCSLSSSTVAANNNDYHGNFKAQFAIGFKDIEDSIRTFDGDETLHVEKWVQEFEEISQVMGLSDFQKFVLAKKSLRGIAKLFISSERNIMSWVSLKNALLKEFKTTTNSAKLHKIISERKIRKDESVT